MQNNSSTTLEQQLSPLQQNSPVVWIVHEMFHLPPSPIVGTK